MGDITVLTANASNEIVMKANCFENIATFTALLYTWLINFASLIILTTHTLLYCFFMMSLPTQFHHSTLYSIHIKVYIVPESYIHLFQMSNHDYSTKMLPY